MSDLAAILLAGGRGSRMGGVRKPLLEVGGTTLLDAAVAAARDARCAPIVGVGETVTAGAAAEITWVREDPPFGGPVAAILAALPVITAPRTLVLACDLPEVAAAVRLLLAAPAAADGACLLDPAGRRQPLTGLYRTDALRRAGAGMPGGGRDAAVRTLLAGLRIAGVAASGRVASDIDTWDDLNDARRRSR